MKKFCEEKLRGDKPVWPEGEGRSSRFRCRRKGKSPGAEARDEEARDEEAWDEEARDEEASGTWDWKAWDGRLGAALPVAQTQR